MHISEFFSDDKYSVVTIFYNYLQINDQIPLFLKKNVLKYLCENFDTNKFYNFFI